MAAGSTLASAGPAKYVEGTPLDLTLGKVPNGKNRVVVAEVREGDNSGLPILYFGLSEPFAINLTGIPMADCVTRVGRGWDEPDWPVPTPSEQPSLPIARAA